MRIKSSIIQPSSSRITVWEHDPIIIGTPTTVINSLNNVANEVHNQSKTLIGYASRSWAQPRFKGYETDGRLVIYKILIIYQADNKSDATEVEALLISKFKNKHPNNCNIRDEQRREDDSKDTKYFVYLATEKLP